MFYTKYRMFEDGMEIMLPSLIEAAASMVSSQYLWKSEDKRILVNVVKGNADLVERDMENRLDSYYHGFMKDVKGFEGIHVKKLRMYGRTYGEIRYRSHMIGYDFFNIFILGIYEGREIIITIQCLEDYAHKNLHIFENISDSIRILKEPEEASYKKQIKERNLILKLIYVGNNKNITLNIDRDEYLIGRETVPTISKITKAVSRKHCMVTKMNGKYFVQDLKSLNGTLVNGIRIPSYELMELFENDIISMANMDFRVRYYFSSSAR